MPTEPTSTKFGLKAVLSKFKETCINSLKRANFIMNIQWLQTAWLNFTLLIQNRHLLDVNREDKEFYQYIIHAILSNVMTSWRKEKISILFYPLIMRISSLFDTNICYLIFSEHLSSHHALNRSQLTVK